MYIVNETGVQSTSEMFFSSTTQKGMELFYYPVCVGHFYCSQNYRVERKSHYSILIMHILKGSCYVETEFSSGIAKQGDTIIIDCWQPHKYKVIEEDSEFVWLHIDGGNCRQLCKTIVEQNGNVLNTDSKEKISDKINEIYNIVSKKLDCPEAVLSSYVYSLFCSCFIPKYDIKKDVDRKEKNSISAIAKGFIFNNLSSKITVKEISSHVHLSPSQFSKVFKEQTGFSPYDYVLVTRLTMAKELLLETDMTISEIALETGFHTDCNFTTFFTYSTGISPSKFRKEYINI